MTAPALALVLVLWDTPAPTGCSTRGIVTGYSSTAVDRAPTVLTAVDRMREAAAERGADTIVADGLPRWTRIGRDRQVDVRGRAFVCRQ